MTHSPESQSPAVPDEDRPGLHLRLPSVHPLLRWPLRIYKWLASLLGLGLFTNIVVLLFSHGFTGFLPAARGQVAALLALFAAQPLGSALGAVAILVAFLFALWAERDYEHELALYKNALEKQRATEAGAAAGSAAAEAKIQTALDERLPGKLDVADVRTRYLKELLARYDTVLLPVVPPGGHVALDAVFQPLKLRRDPLVAEDLERSRRRSLPDESPRESSTTGANANDSQFRPESEPGVGQGPTESEQKDGIETPLVFAENGTAALQQSPARRMVVLGSPGAGKTTVVKDLLRRAAIDALRSPESLIPIFVQLPSLAQAEEHLPEKSVQPYLQREVQGLGIDARFAETLWDNFTHGHAVVCLDGLDEVAPAQRSSIIEMINRDAASYGGIWIVASRFTEYKGGQFQRGLFTEWELQPLDHDLRLELASRLLPTLTAVLQSTKTLPTPASSDPAEPGTVIAEAGISGSPATPATDGVGSAEQALSLYSPTTAAQFVAAIEAHPEAAAWGESPLLFSLAAVPYVRVGTLPSSRAGLYREVVEAVLAMREPTREWRTLLRRFCADFALWLYRAKRGRTFSGADLTSFLLDEERRSAGDAVEIARRIVSSGLVETVAQETYGFRHQTFQEYLAAAGLATRFVDVHDQVRDEAWNLAWSKRTYSRWSQVLQLLVGVLVQEHGNVGQQQAYRWTAALTHEHTTPEGDVGSLGLELALKSLSEARAGFRTHLRGDASVPADADKGAHALVSGADVDYMLAIGSIGKELLHTWVASQLMAASAERYTLMNRLVALAADVRHLDPELLDYAVDTLTAGFEQSSGFPRAIMILTSTTLGETVPLELFLRGAIDTNVDVRRFAVRELARRATVDKQNGILFALIVEMAEHDNHPVGRREAINMLGTLGDRVSHQTIENLFADRDAGVRETVLRALWNYLPDNVIDSALRDSDPSVRSSAVMLLLNSDRLLDLSLILQLARDKDVNVSQAVAQVGAGWIQRGEWLQRVALPPSEDDLEPDAQDTAAVPYDKGKLLQSIGDLALTVADKELVQQIARVALLQLAYQFEYINRLVLGEGDTLASDERWNPLREELRSALTELTARLLAELEITPSALADLQDASPEDVTELMSELRQQEADDGDVDLIIPLAGMIFIYGYLDIGPVPEVLISTLLADSDPIVRAAAASATHLLTAEHGIQMLSQLVREDSQPAVRIRALYLMLRWPEQLPLTTVIDALNDRDDQLRWIACRVLGALHQQYPKEGIDLLAGRIKDSEWRVRQEAVLALDRFEDAVPLEAWVEALRDTHEQVRATAINCVNRRLQNLSSEEWALAISKTQANARRLAAQLVSSAAEPVNQAVISAYRAALGDENPDVRTEVFDAVSKIGGTTPRALIAELENATADSDVLMRLVLELAREDEEKRLAAVELLFGGQGRGALSATRVLDLLNSEQRQVGIAAARVLETIVAAPNLQAWNELDSPDALNALHQAMQNAQYSVRTIAAWALLHARGSLTNPLLIKALAMLLPLDADDTHYQFAASIVDNMGTAAFSQAVVQALQSESIETRISAAIIMRAVPARLESVPHELLRQASLDSSWQIRHAAIIMLAHHYQQQSVTSDLRREITAICVQALSDITMQVRFAAAESLGTVLQTWQEPATLFSSLLDAYWATSSDLHTVTERLQAEANLPPSYGRVALPEPYTGYGYYERLPVFGAARPLRDPIVRPNTSALMAIVKDLETASASLPFDNVFSAFSPMLESEYAAIRAEAASILATYHSQEDNSRSAAIQDRLSPLLDDSAYAVREVVIRAWKQWLLPLPSSSWTSTYGDVRVVAIEELNGQEAIPVERLLATTRTDEDQDVCLAALRVLGTLGIQTPVADIVAGLLSRPRTDSTGDTSRNLEYVTKNLLQALSDVVPSTTLIPTLSDALSAEGNSAQLDLLVAACRPILKQWEGNEQIIAKLSAILLHDPESSLREAAGEVIAQLGDQVPVELLVTVLRNDTDSGVRQAAIRALAPVARQEQATYALVDALHDEGETVRSSAADLFRDLTPPVSVTIVTGLIEALADESVSVRYSVVRALRAVSSSAPAQIADALIRVLADNTAERSAYYNVRAEAVEALANIRTLDQLDGPDQNALRQRCHDALLLALGDLDTRVRADAIKVLAPLQDDVTASKIQAALGDTSWDVCDAAAESLEKFHFELYSEVIPEAGGVLLGNGAEHIFGAAVNTELADLLSNLGRPSASALTTLTQLLDWPYWETRMHSIQALGTLRRNIPDSALRRLYALRHDPDSQPVRAAADDALAGILSLESGIEDD